MMLQQKPSEREGWDRAGKAAGENLVRGLAGGDQDETGERDRAGPAFDE